MRKFITALALVAAGATAGIIPATANAATTRAVVWTVTGYATVVHPGTVNWTRKSFSTKAAADTYLVKASALQSQVCPLSPVSCAKFVEGMAIVG